MSYRNRSSGFTLIEMMIVVVLIGIVAAYAVPSFTQLVERNRVSSTVNSMLGILNYARSEAIKAGQTIDVTPLTGTDWDTGVVVWLDANNDNNRDASEELRRFTDIPNGLAVAGGANAIGFRGNGFLIPDTAAEFQFSVTSPNTPVRFVCTGFSGRVRTAEVAC
ncbi:MAG: GspH/FimT family pseudopilin [Marinobacter sp.]|uniref:GspH/FimT family pseudopilin n=1 Tax=Marinobacter sp. TaxID=50741 RepID=UPI0034A04591